MLRLLADENFNGRILRALKRQIPDLDVVRAQDTRMSGADDTALLEFAAGEKRVLLTHDQETLVGHKRAGGDEKPDCGDARHVVDDLVLRPMRPLLAGKFRSFHR